MGLAKLAMDWDGISKIELGFIKGAILANKEEGKPLYHK